MWPSFQGTFAIQARFVVPPSLGWVWAGCWVVKLVMPSVDWVPGRQPEPRKEATAAKVFGKKASAYVARGLTDDNDIIIGILEEVHSSQDALGHKSIRGAD